MTGIDSHIHLDKYAPEEQAHILQELPDIGIEQLIAVSMDLASCRDNLTLHRQHPGRVKPAFGFHPEQPLPSDAEMDALFHWMSEHRREMTAVGEVGLPYYIRKEAEREGRSFELAFYIGLLDRFAEFAAAERTPMVLHAVYEDADTACDLLEKHGVTKAHFHWFKGSASTIDRMKRSGYFISFTPDIWYEEEIRNLAAAYPLELMMAETDGLGRSKGVSKAKGRIPA